MICLLYVAAKSERIKKEVALSIQSLLYVAPEYVEKNKIVIYTDTPDFFCEKFENITNLCIETLDDKTIKKWFGKAEYKFTIKPKAIIHCLKKYNMPTVFIDGDTVFLKNPEKLFNKIKNPKNLLLYYNENTVDSLYNFGLKTEIYMEGNGQLLLTDIINDGKITVKNKSYKLDANTKLWNSGIIGIHPKEINIIKEQLMLSNYLHEKYNMALAEQVAISIAGSKKNIIPVNDEILHYWIIKDARFIYESYFCKDAKEQEKILKQMPEHVKELLEKIDFKKINYHDLIKLISHLIIYQWTHDMILLDTYMQTRGFLRDVVFNIDNHVESMKRYGKFC
jgi:hypothetical protein